MPPPVTHNTNSNTYWNTNQQWRWESQWSQHTWQESPNQPSSGSQHLDSIAWTNQYQTTPINQPPICDPSQENTTLESSPNPPNHHTTALDNIANSPFEQPAPAWRGGYGSSSEASGWRGGSAPPLIHRNSFENRDSISKSSLIKPLNAITNLPTLLTFRGSGCFFSVQYYSFCRALVILNSFYIHDIQSEYFKVQGCGFTSFGHDAIPIPSKLHPTRFGMTPNDSCDSYLNDFSYMPHPIGTFNLSVNDDPPTEIFQHLTPLMRVRDLCLAVFLTLPNDVISTCGIDAQNTNVLFDDTVIPFTSLRLVESLLNETHNIPTIFLRTLNHCNNPQSILLGLVWIITV